MFVAFLTIIVSLSCKCLCSASLSRGTLGRSVIVAFLGYTHWFLVW